MIENIIIGVLFVAALGYIGNRLYSALSSTKSGCAKGCNCQEEA